MYYSLELTRRCLNLSRNQVWILSLGGKDSLCLENIFWARAVQLCAQPNLGGVATGGVCLGGGGVTPQKIFKNRENSGKIRENSVTSGNICGC